MKTIIKEMRVLLLAGTVTLVQGAIAQKVHERHAEQRTIPMERVTQELGLSTEQEARLKAIRVEHETMRAEVRTIEDPDERRIAMKNVARGQREAIQAVLTSEQREKAAALRAERRMQMKHGGEHARIPSSERAEKRTQEMTRRLDLSEVQAAELQDVMLRHMEKMEQVKRMEDEDGRRMAVEQGKRSLSDQVNAILTPEQRTRWEAMKAERRTAPGRSGPKTGGH